MIQRLIVALTLFIFTLPAQAGVYGKVCGTEGLHVRITADVGAEDKTGLCIQSGHDQFLSVNGVGVSFEEVGYVYQHCFQNMSKPLRYEYDACVPKSILKVSGSNVFKFGICNGFEGGVSCTSTAYVDQNTSVNLTTAGGKRVHLFQVHRLGKGATYTGECRTGSGAVSEKGSCLGDIDSYDIIPEIIQEITDITGQVNSLRSQGRQLSSAEQDKLNALDRALKVIQEKSFEELSEADLITFQEARTILLDGKKKSGELLEAINGTIQEIRQRLTQIKTEAAAQLGDLGVDLQSDASYKDAISFVMPPLSFEALPSDEPFNEQNSVFWILANSSVKSLSDHWQKGDRRRFLETVAAWTEKSDSLYRRYAEMLTSSSLEQQAYINATQHVDNALYGESGYLLRNNWFKDSPIPPELIQATEEMLAKDAYDPFARKLKKTLGLYSGKLDEKQIGIVFFTYTMVKFLNVYKEAYEEQSASGAVLGPSANPNDLWLTQAKANIEEMRQEALQSLEMGVDLYVMSSPAAPVFSLCELITQRKFCDFHNPRQEFSYLRTAGQIVTIIPTFVMVRIFGKIQRSTVLGTKVFGEDMELGARAFKAMDKIGVQTKEEIASMDKLGMSKIDDLEVFSASVAGLPKARISQIVTDSARISPSKEVQSFSPEIVKFSQSSVNGVEEIVKSMRESGWLNSADPIDVVKMADGTLITVDNTRLLAASRVGIDVKARVRAADESIDPSRAVTLKDRAGNVPSTWEQGVKNRISTQNAKYRETYPNGSYVVGSVE